MRSTPTLKYLDPPGDPESLHEALYLGEIIRFSELTQMAAIVAFTRSFVEERLAPHPPVEIHEHVPSHELARRLGEMQSDYARSPEAKRLWRDLFEGIGLVARALW